MWDYQACTEMIMPMCFDGIADMFEKGCKIFQTIIFQPQNFEPGTFQPNIFEPGGC